jgi:hypothetical protein
VPLTLKDVGADCHLQDLLQDGSTPVSEKGTCELQLDGYGYRWLRIHHPGDRRLR